MTLCLKQNVIKVSRLASGQGFIQKQSKVMLRFNDSVLFQFCFSASYAGNKMLKQTKSRRGSSAIQNVTFAQLCMTYMTML